MLYLILFFLLDCSLASGSISLYKRKLPFNYANLESDLINEVNQYQYDYSTKSQLQSSGMKLDKNNMNFLQSINVNNLDKNKMDSMDLMNTNNIPSTFLDPKEELSLPNTNNWLMNSKNIQNNELFHQDNNADTRAILPDSNSKSFNQETKNNKLDGDNLAQLLNGIHFTPINNNIKPTTPNNLNSLYPSVSNFLPVFPSPLLPSLIPNLPISSPTLPNIPSPTLPGLPTSPTLPNNLFTLPTMPTNSVAIPTLPTSLNTVQSPTLPSPESNPTTTNLDATIPNTPSTTGLGLGECITFQKSCRDSECSKKGGVKFMSCNNSGTCQCNEGSSDDEDQVYSNANDVENNSSSTKLDCANLAIIIAFSVFYILGF